MAHYFNVVRAGSSVSNPSAVLLDTGETLKVETLSGAELKKRGLDAGEPVVDTTQVVVIWFPAVTPGQSVRLRITEKPLDERFALLLDVAEVRELACQFDHQCRRRHQVARISLASSSMPRMRSSVVSVATLLAPCACRHILRRS